MLTTILGASTGALGAYNMARFAMTSAIKVRRARKEARRLDSNVRKALKFAEGAYNALSDGVSAEEATKAKAIAAAVKEALAEIKK